MPKLSREAACRVFKIERQPDGIYAVTIGKAEPQRLLQRGDIAGAQQQREKTMVDHSVRPFEELSLERHAELMGAFGG